LNVTNAEGWEQRERRGRGGDREMGNTGREGGGVRVERWGTQGER